MARRPRSAFLRRSPAQPAGWVPGPATVAYRDGFPGTPFCFLHAFRAVSPLSATTQLCFRSGDRRTANPPPTAGPLPWPAFIRLAVQAPASDCLEYSPNTECHFPASIASGIPIFGTPSTAPGPVPTSCSSHIATTGSSVGLMGSEGVRERTLDLAMPPRPSPEPVMKIRGDPGV